ncbi:MAG: preprotein translocase subunit YajC [Chryseobacterium sp.]|nr:MAG: preprotein translocase subunit YajC [Chryseobacterium sp.]
MSTLSVFLQVPAQGGNSSMMLIMMGVMFVGFYFLMIRPQMRKQKQEKNFQEFSFFPHGKELTMKQKRQQQI